MSTNNSANHKLNFNFPNQETHGHNYKNRSSAYVKQLRQMSAKKNPFFSIDALPVAVLCALTFALAAKRTIEVWREHGMSIRRHSASYEFKLPEDVMKELTQDEE